MNKTPASEIVDGGEAWMLPDTLANMNQNDIKRVAITTIEFLQLSYDQLAQTFVLWCCAFVVLYAMNYAVVTRQGKLQHILTYVSLASFVTVQYFSNMDCNPFKAPRNFFVFAGLMKTMDMYMRYLYSSPLIYKTPGVSQWLQAWHLSTQLRYESFIPCPIRLPKDYPFSEVRQWLLNLAILLGSFAIPWNYFTAMMQAVLSINVVWTLCYLPTRWTDSPAFFGPFWKAQNLVQFWTETWHNAFTSPCTTIAYHPVRNTLKYLGVPDPLARGFGVTAAFFFMGLFHVYAAWDMGTTMRLQRLLLFFVINGMATSAESVIWGKRNHWMRTTLAWVFQFTLATWTVYNARFTADIFNMSKEELCALRII